MTKVLVIYSILPESIQLYLFDVNEYNTLECAELNKLRQCHGHYGNEDEIEDDHPVNEWLPNYLVDKNKIYDSIGEDRLLIEHGPVEMIITGFIL